MKSSGCPSPSILINIERISGALVFNKLPKEPQKGKDHYKFKSALRKLQFFFYFIYYFYFNAESLILIVILILLIVSDRTFWTTM